MVGDARRTHRLPALEPGRLGKNESLARRWRKMTDFPNGKPSDDEDD